MSISHDFQEKLPKLLRLKQKVEEQATCGEGHEVYLDDYSEKINTRKKKKGEDKGLQGQPNCRLTSEPEVSLPRAERREGGEGRLHQQLQSSPLSLCDLTAHAAQDT